MKNRKIYVSWLWSTKGLNNVYKYDVYQNSQLLHDTFEMLIEEFQNILERKLYIFFGQFELQAQRVIAKQVCFVPNANVES